MLKTIILADKILLLLVKIYTDNRSSRFFDFDFFKSSFPDVDHDQLIDAIYMLEQDGLVSVMDADDIPYMTQLLPSAKWKKIPC